MSMRLTRSLPFASPGVRHFATQRYTPLLRVSRSLHSFAPRFMVEPPPVPPLTDRQPIPPERTGGNRGTYPLPGTPTPTSWGQEHSPVPSGPVPPDERERESGQAPPSRRPHNPPEDTGRTPPLSPEFVPVQTRGHAVLSGRVSLGPECDTENYAVSRAEPLPHYPPYRQNMYDLHPSLYPLHHHHPPFVSVRLCKSIHSHCTALHARTHTRTQIGSLHQGKRGCLLVADIGSCNGFVLGENPKEKEYILDEARTLFRQNKSLTEPEEIHAKLFEAESRLELGRHYKIPYPRMYNVAPGTVQKVRRTNKPKIRAQYMDSLYDPHAQKAARPTDF